MKCANKPVDFIPSSFFRDDHEASRPRSLMRQQSDGVVLEPLNFPPTKTVLWNRIPQGPQETLELSSQRNIPLLINEKTLWLAHRHCSQISSPFKCFLIGNISVNSKQDGIDLIIDRFDPGREIIVGKNGTSKVKRKVPTTIVPGDHILPVTLVNGLSGAENSVTHSTTEFQNSLKVLHSRVSSQDPLNLSNIVTFKACCHIHGSDDEVIYNLHCGGVIIATSILATPVCSVPIIPTALARNLSGPLRLSDVQGTPKCGFLTMDHTRKLLLLLESDPKACSLPLVGIWVSGLYNIHHPYIWACCVRYLQSSAVEERVFAPPSSFLLLVYSPVSAAPEFWECSQQQDQCNGHIFQLYSCSETLHVEVPPNAKSSEPLCFEMLPATDGMNRVLFQQAVGSWLQEQQSQGSVIASTGHPGSMAEPSNPVNRAEQDHAEEEQTPLPRPSPSPHPQSRQHQFDLSTIPEVSLSLSFDESFLQDNRPQPLDRGDHTTHQPKNILAPKQPKQNQSRHPTGQENVGFVSKKDRHAGIRRVVTHSRSINSPSRQPLKQVMSPNQMGMSGAPLRVNTKRQAATPVGHRRSEVLKVNDTHAKHSVSPQGSQHVHKAGSAQTTGSSHNRSTEMGAKRTRASLPHASETRTFVEQGNGQILQRRLSLEEVHSDAAYGLLEAGNNEATNPRPQILEQSCSIETVNDTHCSTTAGRGGQVPLNQSIGTEMESGSFQQSHGETERAKNASSCPNTNQQQHNQPPQNLQEEEKSQQPRRKVQEPRREVAQYENDACFLDLSSNNSVPGGAGTSAGSCTNPYELLMQQQMQLAQLQAQIQLLTKQLNSTLPTPVGLLTPPRTPVLPSDRDDTSQSRDRVAKVSVCTNTGVSLLLSTPAKDSGNISAAISPLKDSKLGQPCSRSDREPGSSPEKTRQKDDDDPHSFVQSPAESCKSVHMAETSHDENTSLNADKDLANKTLVTDDPSQSLASSLNAVDIQSFYGSPSPQNEPNDSGATESQFTSPVLGESASLVSEQGKRAKQKTNQEEVDEDEEPGDEDQPDSLLHRNEKEFYDNLLSQVKHLLDKQNEGPPDDSTSIQGSPDATHADNQTAEVTPEEVAKATAEELDKLINPVIPSGTLSKSVKDDRQLSLIHYATSQSALPTHPRINYISIAVDETMDEVSSEADNIALKYLSEQEITELNRHSGRRGRSARFPNTPSSSGRVLLGNSELGAVLEHERASVVGSSDFTWNNLSFATRNYLGKYHLAPPGYAATKSEEEKRNAGADALSERRGAGSEKAEDSTCAADGRHESTVSLACLAPPPTPEVNNREKTSNILDIGRLKKLPKLF